LGQSGQSGTGSSGSYGQSGQTGTGSSGSYGQSGSSGSSTYGQSGTGSTGSQGSMGSSSGSMGSSGASGSASASDQGNLRTVTGQVQKVDQNSITLDQGVTLTVDSQTQVLRRGQPVAAGISAIHEGTQVRASFDPASNRAEKIEVMGKRAKSRKNSNSSMGQGSDPSKTPSQSDTSNPK